MKDVQQLVDEFHRKMEKNGHKVMPEKLEFRLQDTKLKTDKWSVTTRHICSENLTLTECILIFTHVGQLTVQDRLALTKLNEIPKLSKLGRDDRTENTEQKDKAT
tara:strand:- start:1006 stop:1320 length:315 start_codon:yes stop_codon:yes gene_type:complete